MNYQQRAAEANSIFNQGLKNVANKRMPKGQKFAPGLFVKIADDLGSMMSHFDGRGKYARVEHTYAHAYPQFQPNNIKSYSLLVRHDKDNWSSSSWYYEDQLTAVNDEKILQELQNEFNNITNKIGL